MVFSLVSSYDKHNNSLPLGVLFLQPAENTLTPCVGFQQNPAMRVTKLLHTRMRVGDMEDPIRFYTEVIGLEVLERKTSPRGSHLAFLKVPNSEELIELCSFPASGPVKVQEDLVHLAFQVDNLDDTIRALEAKGIKITDGPTTTSSGSRFIFIDAPDGYEIELIERPPGVAIV
jgi:lactoylglutathione lyase